MSGRQIYKIACATLVVGVFYSIAAQVSPLRAQTANNLVCSSCVNGSDIANFSVSAGKLSVNSVTNPKIKTGAVTQGKIANGAVTGPKIASFSVSSGKLSANSVTNPKIAAGAVTSGKLASGSKPAGADFVTTNENLVAIPDTGSIVLASVTVTTPAAGTVIVNASSNFSFFVGPGRVHCEIVEPGTFSSVTALTAQGNLENNIAVYARSRGFTVGSGGSVVYDLECSEQFGSAFASKVSLTAIFVPQRY